MSSRIAGMTIVSSAGEFGGPLCLPGAGRRWADEWCWAFDWCCPADGDGPPALPEAGLCGAGCCDVEYGAGPGADACCGAGYCGFCGFCPGWPGARCCGAACVPADCWGGWCWPGPEAGGEYPPCPSAEEASVPSIRPAEPYCGGLVGPLGAGALSAASTFTASETSRPSLRDPAHAVRSARAGHPPHATSPRSARPDRRGRRRQRSLRSGWWAQVRQDPLTHLLTGSTGIRFHVKRPLRLSMNSSPFHGDSPRMWRTPRAVSRETATSAATGEWRPLPDTKEAAHPRRVGRFDSSPWRAPIRG